MPIGSLNVATYIESRSSPHQALRRKQSCAHDRLTREVANSVVSSVIRTTNHESRTVPGAHPASNLPPAYLFPGVQDISSVYRSAAWCITGRRTVGRRRLIFRTSASRFSMIRDLCRSLQDRSSGPLALECCRLFGGQFWLPTRLGGKRSGCVGSSMKAPPKILRLSSSNAAVTTSRATIARSWATLRFFSPVPATVEFRPFTPERSQHQLRIWPGGKLQIGGAGWCPARCRRRRCQSLGFEWKSCRYAGRAGRKVAMDDLRALTPNASQSTIFTALVSALGRRSRAGGLRSLDILIRGGISAFERSPSWAHSFSCASSKGIKHHISAAGARFSPVGVRSGATTSNR